MGFNISGIVVLQLFLYLSALVSITLTLRRLGYNEVWFIALAAIYPFGAIYSAFVSVEAWLIFLVSVSATLIARHDIHMRHVILAGVLSGMAAMCRSDMLLLPVVLALAILWPRWRIGSVNRSLLLRAAVVPALATCVMIPYSYWNLTTGGGFRPSPTAAAVGSSLYTTTWQEHVGLDDLNALNRRQVTRQAVRSGLISEVIRLNSSIGAPPLTPPFNPAAYPTRDLQIRSNLVFGTAALERVRSDPQSYLRRLMKNLFLLWNTSEYPDAIPGLLKVGLRVVSLIVSLAGLAMGIWILISKRERWREAQLSIMMLYPYLVHIPLHTEARYTAASRPLLLMFASLLLIEVVRSWRAGKWRLSNPAV